MAPALLHAKSPVQDAGFEATPLKEWELRSENNGTATADRAIKHAGEQSIRLDAEATEGRTALRQQIKTRLSGPVEASVRIRSASAEKGAFLEIATLDADGRVEGRFQSAPIVGTTFEETWEPVTVRFKAPKGTSALRVQLVLHGKGTAWFDEVTLSASSTTEATRAPVSEAEMTERVIHETFDEPLNTDLWLPVSETTVPKEGRITIRPGDLLRTRMVYPEGIVEMRLRIRGDAAFLGFGYRQKYGGPQHIGYTSTPNRSGIHPVLQAKKGKRQAEAPVPIDGEFHTYRIIWESGLIRFLIDGKEHARFDSSSYDLDPTAISVYNQTQDAEIDVEEISIYLSPKDKENLKTMQEKGHFAFVEVPYHESEPAPVPTAQEQAQGAILFQRNPLEHLFPTSHPRTSERVATLKVAATPGEVQPVLLGLHALRAMELRTLSIGEAKAQEGDATIPADAFRPGIIRTLAKRHLYFHGWSLNYTWFPMLIEPMAPTPMEAARSQGLWIDCAIPEGTPPGRYQTTVTMESESGSFALPLEVEVFGFTLAKTSEMYYGAFETNFQSLASTGKERPERVRAVIEEMAENGMTTIGFTSNWATIQHADDGPKVKVSDYYVEIINAYKAAGLTLPLIQLNNPAYHLYMTRNSDEKKRTGYGPAILALREEMLRRTNHESYLIPVDEPSYHGPKTRQMTLEALRSMQAQKIPSAQDGPVDNFMTQEVLPLTDMLIFNGAVPSDAVLQKARERNIKVLLYNTDVETWRPVVNRYSAGFLQEKYQLQGLIQWEYQMQPNLVTSYHEIEPDLGWAYMANYYPKIGNRPGGPTLAWKGFRAGIYDYRYLLTLRREIERVTPKNPALAKEASEALQKLIASLEDLRQIRQSAKWSGGEEKRLSGIYNLANGWSLDDYDKARLEIAHWILRLQKH